MNRTLGFFLGSAAVFAMLVYILGQPVPLAQPVNRDAGLRKEILGTEPIQIPAPITKPVAAAPQPAKPVLPTIPDKQEPEPVPVTPAPATVDEPDENALAEIFLAQTKAPQPEQSSVPAVPDTAAAIDNSAIAAGPVDELEWYPVWDPFHSELSANAFARRLERVTGLDYRVIKTSATNYRVAVGYTSEEQRAVNVTMIEEATGLTISGGSH
ncbi:MAG: hypothetical protein OER80_10680 [Gammaproteobacteria bacterium]|nr:hypothetical protein [Gammaproteobacteria bacterium]MDH3768431.1 hypothetical protein [Gammaproteobacteria bacterium]